MVSIASDLPTEPVIWPTELNTPYTDDLSRLMVPTATPRAKSSGPWMKPLAGS